MCISWSSVCVTQSHQPQVVAKVLPRSSTHPGPTPSSLRSFVSSRTPAILSEGGGGGGGGGGREGGRRWVDGWSLCYTVCTWCAHMTLLMCSHDTTDVLTWHYWCAHMALLVCSHDTTDVLT